MVAISFLGMNYENPRPYQTRKGDAKASRCSLQAKRQADYESRLPHNRKATPKGCFHLYFNVDYEYSMHFSGKPSTVRLSGAKNLCYNSVLELSSPCDKE